MAHLPLKARLCVVAVIAAGAVLLALVLPAAAFHRPALFIVLLGLSSLAAALKVALPLTASGSTMSASYAVDFCALLLLGPHETTLIAAGSALIQCRSQAGQRNPLYRTLFSVASIVLTVQGAGLAFHAMGGTGAAAPISLMARPLVGAAAVYFLLNTGFIATAIALSAEAPIVAIWIDTFLWSAPSYFVGAATAAVVSWMMVQVGDWVVPFTFGPIYLTYRTYRVYLGRLGDEQRHIRQTSDLHLATIEALARAIDAKDQTTHMHIRRVQVYSAGLARAAGLPDEDIKAIKTAALLHDIGKLAVPEHILSKPGPLTQEEFQKVRIHPQVGADIIAAVPFPYPVAPLILSHHERWDGKGYPQGLKGENIPIGARVLTVVDYYDAVTTQRPYHKALSHESAIGLLRHEAGRALDPQLVPIFVKILPALKAEMGCAEETAAAAEPAAEGDAQAAARHAVWPASAFENIALAHREIYALYEIAQSMGTSLGVSDTMALISSKLVKLVPWSGCSLFLYDAESRTLKCRYAAGADAPALVESAIERGGGLADWLANNRRTLVNAEPHAGTACIDSAAETVLRSAILCPLHVNDAFIGCIALYHTEPDHYTEDHRRLLERIAEQAGPVIHNSIVFEQTHEDSLTDPLTGLPNRRSMFAHLSRELARAERLKGEVALIVMDIDGFKTINDTYGHSVGDHALRTMATVLQDTLRSYDICVRYAGDEFIVVLTDTSREAADAKMRELQSRVDSIEIEVRPGKRVALAASAGAAVFPCDGRTYEALLADADQRMYRDKAARRGHVAAQPGQTPAEFVPAEVVEAVTLRSEHPSHLTVA